MTNACGNPDCRMSTGVHYGITFGSGKLNKHGFWEFPCLVCAKNWDDTKDERIAQLKSEGLLTDEKLNSYAYAWIAMPGWPYDPQKQDTHL